VHTTFAQFRVSWPPLEAQKILVAQQQQKGGGQQWGILGVQARGKTAAT